MLLWHHFGRETDGSESKGILEHLGNAGIQTRPFQWDAPPGPGIIFLAEVTEQACQFIRQCSDAGGRVLAVALYQAALAGGAVWQLLQAGAADVVAWDCSASPADDLAARFERWEAIDELMRAPVVRDNLVGQSPAWTSILRQVVEITRFTSASVLITGESGTGKELIARLIHTLDARPRKGDLVVLDCTTVVPELSGSEFFGHERGAFTGAASARDGAFALASGGTLFLDEVGELPLPLQAELLRVVQEHTFKRVGSNVWQKAEFRLVCASNRELLQEKANGNFRPDLYFRIANWTCHLPPLRERREDILPLARHFVRQFCPGEEPPELDPAVQAYLLAHEYPGNIRELRQAVSRMVYRHIGKGPITPGDIPEDERPAWPSAQVGWRDREFEGVIQRAVSMGATLREIGRAAEDAAVRFAVATENGNLQMAAQKLGVTDRTLQMRRAAWRRGKEGKNDNPSSTAS